MFKCYYFSELLKELENTVLKLTGSYKQNNQDGKSGQPPSTTGSGTTSGVIKTSEDMKMLKHMVKRKVEESLDDIIEETAGQYRTRTLILELRQKI